MIFLCAAGMGKTTLASVQKGIVDYDTQVVARMLGFKRDPYWVFSYVDSLLYLDKQGFTVLGNITKDVVKGLEAAGVDFHIIIPDMSLKQAWLKRLTDRYKAHKDDMHTLYALQNTLKDYDLIYKDNANRENTTVIKSMDYSLEEIINSLKKS